jgi:hypothetical protein
MKRGPLIAAAWILIAPPIGKNGRYNSSAPRSQWKTVGSYPTSVDCVEAWSAYFTSDAKRHMNPAEMGHLHSYAWLEDDEDPRGDGPICVKGDKP